MDELYVVMYHYVRDLKNSRYPEIKGMDYSLFMQQIKYLNENFNIITMEEVIEAWNIPGKKLPERALLLTFDDGYIDHYLCVYPILKEYGIQGSFFIPGKTFTENILLDVNKIHFILASTDKDKLLSSLMKKLDYYRGTEFQFPSNEVLYQQYAVDERFDNRDVIFIKRILQTVLPEQLRNMMTSDLFRETIGIPEDVFARELYMNREQIRCMKNGGMYIGLHGYDHYWLGNLTEKEIQKDVDKSIEVMGEFIEKNNWVLNYPYGSYSDTVLKNIQSKGCNLAMTTDVRIAQVGRDNKYLIPRLDCNDYPPKSNYYLQKQNI